MLWKSDQGCLCSHPPAQTHAGIYVMTYVESCVCLCTCAGGKKVLVFCGGTMDWRGNAHVHTSIAHNSSLWDAPLPRLVKFEV